jgi:hypothetical protein
MLIGLILHASACVRSGVDFVPFLRDEIAMLGGQTNGLAEANGLPGRWVVSRDQSGAAIDTQDIRYDDLKNLFT